MRMVRKLTFTTLASAAFLAASVLPARADIIVLTSVNNQGTNNVLLNPATNVTVVTGTVGPSNVVVDFTSTSGSDLLSADPSGQARVSGGTGNDPFTNISFFLHNGGTFTRAVFNINAATNGSTQIRVDGVNIGGGFFQSNFAVDANGENFFTVDAINGQLIQKITLTGVNNALFEDLRQVRLGGESSVPVPEPASLILFGAAAATTLAARRRRQKQ
jgi:hypothetical protein